MSDLRTIKLGIIGPGNHAQENLLPAMQVINGIELHVVQSRDQIRAQGVASKFSITHTEVTSDTAKILHDGNCDGIVVSATPQIHQELLLIAIEEGKNIFVEKPPAIDLKGIEDIQRALKQSPKPPVVQFGFNFRYSDFYRQVEEMAKSTPIRYMKIKSFAAKPSEAMWDYDGVVASSLYAVHIHALEMLCFTLGSLVNFEHRLVWVDDRKFVLTIIATFADGKVGVLELSNASNRFEFDVECIDSNENILRCNGFNHMEIFGPDFDTQGIFKSKSYIMYEIPFLRGGFDRTGYSKQFEVFRDAIQSQRFDPRSIDSCVDAYKIIAGVLKDGK